MLKLNPDDVTVTSFPISGEPGDDELMDINTRGCPVTVYTRDGANTCYCTGAAGCNTSGAYAC